jgi:parallel beta-helix repeat protein
MKNLFTLLLFLGVLYRTCIPAELVIKTWYVDSSHQGVNQGTKDQPFTSITDAIDAAAKNDTILVAPGLYKENVVLNDGVILISEALGRAIIDGQADMAGGSPAVTGADMAVIDGFTITGGYNGVSCKGTSPTIRHCIIRSNYGDAGISCVDGANAIIENNTILGNLGSDYKRRPAGIYVEQSNPIIRNNIITGNYFGISLYQSSAVESYNNVWGNRKNYGYDAAPSTGTISVDPGFIDVSYNDYRLSPASPLIDAGTPNPSFNDQDGSRNDMGAYRSGNPVSSPPPIKIQEFFMESVLGCLETQTGIQCDGLSRFAQNPTFYFANGKNTIGAQEIRTAIEHWIPLLSDGRLNAEFVGSLDSAMNSCHVVTIEFGGPGRGVSYFKGADCKNVAAQNLREKEGSEITGGLLDLPTDFMDGIEGPANTSRKETVLHELGHVLGLRHSYRGKENIITQLNARPSEFSDVEVFALQSTFDFPPGYKLGQFKSSGFITEDVKHPFPQIDKIWRLDADNRLRTFDTIAVGDFVVLDGSRFTLKYSEDDRVSFRPPDYTAPKVYFNGIEVTADLNDQTNYVGTPCAMLKVQIPPNATSGFIFLKRREAESNPVYLEVE